MVITREEMGMNQTPEHKERTSVRHWHSPSTQNRYTVSYSYLLEAELDREWEKSIRNQGLISGKSSSGFVQEGRVGI
jgi:hypothetical protein